MSRSTDGQACWPAMLACQCFVLYQLNRCVPKPPNRPTRANLPQIQLPASGAPMQLKVNTGLATSGSVRWLALPKTPPRWGGEGPPLFGVGRLRTTAGWEEEKLKGRQCGGGGGVTMMQAPWSACAFDD